jgi:hypothetical protein
MSPITKTTLVAALTLAALMTAARVQQRVIYGRSTGVRIDDKFTLADSKKPRK